MTLGILDLSFTHAFLLANLLPRIVVKGGSKNCHKSRAQKYLNEQLDGFNEARISLVKEHAKKDSTGNPIIEEGSYAVEDMTAFNKEFATLEKELRILVDASNDTVKKNALEVVRDILLNGESIELNAQESLAYLNFIDAFVEAFPLPQ